MTRVGLDARWLAVAGVVLVGASLAGCGGDGSSMGGAAAASDAASAARPVFPIDRVPTPSGGGSGTAIKGAPVQMAIVGQPYSFQPEFESTAGAQVRFNITNLPSWARFDPTTGLLSGTPGESQVGQYPGIAITLIEGGIAKATLPPFTITVAATDSSSATVVLSWQAPTENADGTPLVDLKGYQVHFGAASNSYSDSIKVANPGLTTYVVQNLAAGTYYFAVTAYNSAGVESSLSPEVSTQVD
ncbi:MAG: putative Ig domain-containing protein [Steroidobacteraceae bacterium]